MDSDELLSPPPPFSAAKPDARPGIGIYAGIMMGSPVIATTTTLLCSQARCQTGDRDILYNGRQCHHETLVLVGHGTVLCSYNDHHACIPLPSLPLAIFPCDPINQIETACYCYRYTTISFLLTANCCSSFF